MKYLTHLQYFLFFIITPTVQLYAQSTVEYASDKIYYQSKTEDVHLSTDDGKLVAIHYIKERKKYNEAVPPTRTSERVYNRSFNEIDNLKVYLGVQKKNGKYSSKKIKDIVLRSSYSGGTFYDDDTYYQISFPKFDNSAYTEIEYELKLKDPHFLKRFYFSEYYPVKNAKYTITIDGNIEIGFKLYGAQKDEVKFSKSTNEDGKITYSWELEDVKAYTPEHNSPGFLHWATHLVVYIKNYESEGEKIEVLSDVQGLFSWYQELLSRIKPSDDTEIKNITTKVIKGATTDLEKAKKIFYWVQDNIRYIAFEDGWRGFIPYPAQEICDKRYGDCKDMTHLTVQMMNYAGLNAKHAWVGTRKLPYNYEDTPCLSADNHLVIAVEIEDSIYVLDATDSYTPFAVPSSFILSKELLFERDGNYTLYQVPTYAPSYCTIQDKITIKPSMQDVTGVATKTIETFEYSKFSHRYHKSDQNKDAFMSDYLELGQNNFVLIDPKIQDEVDREEKTIKYEYEIPKYIKEFGESSFINLNLTKPFSEEIIKKDRKNSYEVDFKQALKLEVHFKLPEGKKPVNLPEETNFSSEIGSVSVKYKLEGDILKYNRLIEIDKLLIEQHEFDKWNEFINTLKAVYNTNIEYN